MSDTLGVVPQPSDERLLVSPTHAAPLLDVSRSTIYEMVRSGELPSVKIGTLTRIPVAALRDWIAAKAADND